jgi:hypothetical protein
VPGERVGLTGRLAAFPGREACARVRAAGGEPAGRLARGATILVVGAIGWSLLPNGAVSPGLRRAEAPARAGAGLPTLSEDSFPAVLGLRPEDRRPPGPD